MTEIKSDVGIASGLTANISGAASNLSSGGGISEDGTTTVAVNENSTTVHELVKKIIENLSSQVSADSERINSIATTFANEDDKISGSFGK